MPEQSLLVFDEIQQCAEALNSLKYFCEKAPEYHVACAGSMLGITLAKPRSFPVGKVDFLDVEPLTFGEFLHANGDEHFETALQDYDELEPLPDALFNPLYEKLKMYFVTGGMPEPVSQWVEDRDVAGVERALTSIINTYERDFMKHPDKNELPRIKLIWNSLPSQLARENKKFLYRGVKENARGREYEAALQWLVDAGLILKVFRSEKPALPLSAYDDLAAFKLYMVDVGILRAHSSLAPTAFGEGTRLFTEFKGALAENFILQSLHAQFRTPIRYWSQPKPPYEVDFIIQRENDVIPVEVKSDANIRSRSLQYYKEKFGDLVKLRVRFSLQNLKLDGDLLNIPLFMSEQADRLIGLALERLAPVERAARPAAQNLTQQDTPGAIPLPRLKEFDLRVTQIDAQRMVVHDEASGQEYSLDISRTKWHGSGDLTVGSRIESAILSKDGSKLFGDLCDSEENA
ncbi:MAG: ATP-binding protein [Pyramidobacter sp.]|nr:ATP-binding protein [Pyramidobacter sp.]